MSSVTGRISEIKQPRGGYVRPAQFNQNNIDDGKLLNELENVHPSIVGMAVDYLTRFVMGAGIAQAFDISLRGARLAEIYIPEKSPLKIADDLLEGIIGLDDNSIINACKMATFDVWYRNPINASISKGFDETNPDCSTIQNIRIMVERSVKFWSEYGPIVKDGFTFEPNGYTHTVDAGDGDFLTLDTLWDFKVIKSKLNSKYTLQLLMYWIMGQHSGQAIYKNIKKLGVFNPRLNCIYTLEVSDISPEVIKEVEKSVICY